MIFRKIGKASAVALALLVGWASWEEPNLHEYAEPVQLVQLHVSGLRSLRQVGAAQQQVAAVRGVQSCVINKQTHVAAVLYREADVSADEIERVLSVGGTFRVTRLAPVAYVPAARECPVPASFLQALDRIRFSLNLRRPFVSI